MKKKMTDKDRQEILQQLHEDNDVRIEQLIEERFPYMKIRIERPKETPKQ